MSRTEAYHVGNGPKSLLREGELFNIKHGVGYYHPGFLRHFPDGVNSYAPDDLWLERETNEAYSTYTDSGSLLIEGTLGSGKSTLIHGVKQRFKEGEQPFGYFNGHYRTTSTTRIVKLMDWCQDNDAPLMWDSMDYLILTSLHRRNITKKRSDHNINTLMPELISRRQQGLRLIATSHDPEWLQNYADKELIEGLWSDLTSSMSQHIVSAKFESPEELMTFFKRISTQSTLPEDVCHRAARLAFEADSTRGGLIQYKHAKLFVRAKEKDRDDILAAHLQPDEEFARVIVDFVSRQEEITHAMLHK